ncbi:MAG TPA: hypothetical protein VGQ99_03950, partial [Tepidisphaeraceae bacterium]|nr:hypothetical protein [Tepidisphaeraceae bacterium]
EPGFGPYGLDAPFPGWLFPATRRTDEQEDPSFGANGPDEYHSMRDLTWSTTDHTFYGADSSGIYRLTADGISTFVGNAAGIDEPKGITFHTFEGQRRLLVSERDGGNLWQVDPATGQTINQIEMLDPNGFPLAGVLSIVEDPASAMLLAIVKPNGFSGDPFARELYQIDPITGASISLGAFGVHMADLAFIVGPPQVTDAEFVYQNAPQRLTFAFDQNVGDSITPGDLSIVRLGPGGGPVVFADPVYDIATNTVTVMFNQILPDGNYRATFSASSVTNTLDMPLAANQVLDFFVLNGDLNRDRQVSISDFIDLAANFGKTTTLWSDGDLNYDGEVTISDFIDLAANFGKTLAPDPGAPAPAAAEAASTTPSENVQTLEADTDRLDIKTNKSKSLFSRSATHRQSHHRRHGHKSAPHWRSRGGAY